ncbi:hypothetical protein L1987_62618 [Smallanthus sonchifolius]|uniref:Uncharacterized protein n=1 Tax=Smallanthus sonchifolius TaxID=185202 RepID=A0ACB9CB39_9ASTR|nr:hypothetical protein L1987_62618 [Smallanthus sonchifolius]
MAINRFVVLALVFVAMVAYVSAADTPAGAAGDAAANAAGAIAGAPAGAPDAAGAAGGPSAGGEGGATSGGDAAAGDAPSFKASCVYGVVASVVVVGANIPAYSGSAHTVCADLTLVSHRFIDPRA